MADGGIWSQRVLVLRHGERKDHAPDAPLDFDPPLTTAGKNAISTAAVRVQKILGHAAAKNAVLVVSPFTRCVETAVGLQNAAVGSESPYVIDNGVCEVYGPVRIKHPERQLAHGRRTVPGLPKWGETLDEASDRFVASFLRIADAHAPGGTGSLCRTVDSDSSHPADVSEAVTNRARLPARTAESQPATTRRGTSTLLDSCSTVSDSVNRDIIIVTHGDALSAVLNHFYPSRTVYEAEYLSFLVMKRYGVGNNVFHLDDSVGVHWILDGPDEEPRDPLWVAHRTAAEAPQRPVVDYTYGGYAIPDMEEFSDEADEGCGSAVPQSSVKRSKIRATQGTQRASVTSCAPREYASNARGVPPQPATVAANVSHTPQPANTTNNNTNNTNSNGSGTPTGLTSPTQANGGSPHASGKTHRKKSSFTIGGHPKENEDCDRLYSPNGIPPQSSVNDTHTLDAAPPLQSFGHPNQNPKGYAHGQLNDDSGSYSQRHASAMDQSGFTDLPSAPEAGHGQRDCASLWTSPGPLRRSCLLRAATCLSQLLMYAATPSTMFATCYFLAALIVEALQGFLLFFSIRSSGANHVRHMTEYLYCSQRCTPSHHDTDTHGPTDRPLYTPAGDSSNPGSTVPGSDNTPRAHVVAEDNFHEPAHGAVSETAPDHATAPDTSARWKRVCWIVMRHAVATLVKLALVFFLCFLFTLSDFDDVHLRSTNGLFVALVCCVFTALNITRGVLDEQAEQRSQSQMDRQYHM